MDIINRLAERSIDIENTLSRTHPANWLSREYGEIGIPQNNLFKGIPVKSAHLAPSHIRFTAQYDFAVSDRYLYEKLDRYLLTTGSLSRLMRH